MVREPDPEGERVTTEVLPRPGPVAATAAARGRAAWLGWLVLPLHLALTTAYVLLDRSLGSPAMSGGSGPVIVAAFTLVAAMGALLVVQRPGNAVGWVLAAAALLLAAGAAGDGYAAWSATVRGDVDGLAVAGAIVQQWYWYVVLYLLMAALPLLFPDGQLPSRRWLWRVPAALGALGPLLLVVLGSLTGTLTGQDVGYRIDNPIGVDGMDGGEQHPLFAVGNALLLVGIVTGFAAVVARFRRSRGDERQQMKWFLFAAAPIAVIPLVELLPGWVGGVWLSWIVLSVPAVIAIAVLRYRLDGIDVVLNRTLVYGVLTVGVVAVYVLVVGYLGALLRREDDLTISLVATGLVAVLFAPARDRLQRAVDRLLYGRRAEPYAALAQLGERLEGTLAPEAVLPAIVSAVREALRLPYAAIVLGDGEAPVSSGEPARATEQLPLLHHGVPVGTLVLGVRPGESGFAPADRRLLADLARQAGVAVSTVRLTADLQRSRERLVTAREEERRRLRRDLHDGLGAQLAGLTVQTGLLRTLIPRDPAAADELATELRGELRTAIADVRRLVHDLRPPALDELGRAGALQRLAGRLGAALPVEVRAADLPPLPAAVEVAAYRIVQEALTNVVRHAGATSSCVEVAVDGPRLTVTVTDDGRGLAADRVGGVGTASMRERAEETGGSCEIGPGPGGGTRVVARLPRGTA